MLQKQFILLGSTIWTKGQKEIVNRPCQIDLKCTLNTYELVSVLPEKV